MKKPLLSIIVPAFRAENSIEVLVESLEKQAFKNYEIIIVNDITPDEEHTILTTEVIKKLQKKYDNIVRIDMPHTRYQGHARNEGLKYAKADYIAFADSDDWYADNYFDVTAPELEKGGFELLFFNAYTGNDYSDKYITKTIKPEFIEKEGFKKLLHGEFAHVIKNVPWNKVYLKSIIDKYNVQNENEKKSSEDLLFNLEYIATIQKYKFINEQLYYYAPNPNSSTSKVYDEVEDFKFDKAVKRIAEKYEIKNYYRYYGLFLLRHFIGHIMNERRNSYSVAKENVNIYLTHGERKEIFKHIKLRDFDIKLFISYVLLKTRLYKLILILSKKSK